MPDRQLNYLQQEAIEVSIPRLQQIPPPEQAQNQVYVSPVFSHKSADINSQLNIHSPTIHLQTSLLFYFFSFDDVIPALIKRKAPQPF
jgi:hypothetical protein